MRRSGQAQRVKLAKKLSKRATGGEIVAIGTPEDIVKVKRSYTGRFLQPVLGRRENKRKKSVQAAE